jgi:putative ABC transport system substrate-binding protein
LSAQSLSRRVQLTHLATFHRVPLIAGSRLFAEAGGLMSYGARLTDAFRQVGTYVGRILRRREAGRPASGSVNQIQAGHRP